MDDRQAFNIAIRLQTAVLIVGLIIFWVLYLVL